jgi:hypothetical protein
VVVENHLGRGAVIFSTDPIELHSVLDRHQSDLALYRSVLAAAAVKPIDLQPDDPSVHAFRVPLQDGGRVHVLFNTAETGSEKCVALADEQPAVTVSMAPRRPALVWFDGRGALRAVESQGGCSVGGETLLQDETGGIVMSVDRQDIRRSRALLLMPLRPGSVRLSIGRKWQKAIVLTGDIHDGKWANYETAPAEQSEAGLVVRVSPDQVVSLLLVTEPGSASRWCQAIERAMSDPARLR